MALCKPIKCEGTYRARMQRFAEQERCVKEAPWLWKQSLKPCGLPQLFNFQADGSLFFGGTPVICGSKGHQKATTYFSGGTPIDISPHWFRVSLVFQATLFLMASAVEDSSHSAAWGSFYCSSPLQCGWLAAFRLELDPPTVAVFLLFSLTTNQTRGPQKRHPHN